MMSLLGFSAFIDKICSLLKLIIFPPFFGVFSKGLGVVKSLEQLGSSKDYCFSWQTLLTRIPTKTNLMLRGLALPGGEYCVLCGGYVEMENHLLLMCPFAWSTWVEVYRWFGVVSFSGGYLDPLCFLSSINHGKNVYKGSFLVWHTVVCVFWRTRNEKKNPTWLTLLEGFSIGLNALSGNGYWLRKTMHHVCTMNDMLII
jgi:hypothetical protein